ncbi:hypothetical protein [Halopseudomonas salegens]|uniref:Uncharacterized protein n=1 Tax=Halopseudomonas salegens TaxID=1434072 RepID=A0A1H2I262_9GAMM|nr:hypothetical protein [Halopseudomonas salegens]SDU38094.1 hypothetical protein SAMN05216210_3488 [Halopseudomonas salegens]
MSKHLKYLLAVGLLCLAPLVKADLQTLQTLHEIRSEGYKAATYLLIDNNLYQRVREPGHREAYHEALDGMDSRIRQIDNPSDLRTVFDQFTGMIRDLENQPEDEAHYNLATVNRIMQTHAQLDEVLAERYAEHADLADERLAVLHQQSLETNQILLLYQNNMFSSIGVYFMDTHEGIFSDMNASIVERFSTMRSLLPEQAAAISQLDQQYSFIQPRLITYYQDWVPTIAAFYLLRNTDTLNNLAREQLRISTTG